jgi:hypothetical protein
MQSKAPDAGEVPLHELLAEVLAGDLSDGGFEVQYQPIVRLAGGATVWWKPSRVGSIEGGTDCAGAVYGRCRACWSVGGAG